MIWRKRRMRGRGRDMMEGEWYTSTKLFKEYIFSIITNASSRNKVTETLITTFHMIFRIEKIITTYSLELMFKIKALRDASHKNIVKKHMEASRGGPFSPAAAQDEDFAKAMQYLVSFQTPM